MNAIEYVLWMNGAAEITGDQPPTAEQWAIMREKLNSAVGAIVAARLLENADAFQKAEDLKRKLAADRARLLGSLSPQLVGTAIPRATTSTFATALDDMNMEVLTNAAKMANQLSGRQIHQVIVDDRLNTVLVR